MVWNLGVFSHFQSIFKSIFASWISIIWLICVVVSIHGWYGRGFFGYFLNFLNIDFWLYRPDRKWNQIHVYIYKYLWYMVICVAGIEHEMCFAAMNIWTMNGTDFTVKYSRFAYRRKRFLLTDGSRCLASPFSSSTSCLHILIRLFDSLHQTSWLYSPKTLQKFNEENNKFSANDLSISKWFFHAQTHALKHTHTSHNDAHEYWLRW